MPRKPKLGQNFLVDRNASEQIAVALGDTSTRTVVEIGPGHGAITALLAPRCARLHCIEFDPDLALELKVRFRNDPHVTIHHGDILKSDLATLTALPPDLSSRPERSEVERPAFLPPQTPTEPPVDVIGNLPYYITSDILLHLYAAAREGLLRRAVVMMQREVAERIAAPPGESDYGALSAFTQLHADVQTLFTLPPSAFSPPPDVYSTVVRMEFAPRFEDLQVDPESFNAFLRAGFMQKRKTLANNLRNAGFSADQVSKAWPEGLGLQARAEVVSLEQLAALYRGLGKNKSI